MTRTGHLAAWFSGAMFVHLLADFANVPVWWTAFRVVGLIATTYVAIECRRRLLNRGSDTSFVINGVAHD